MVVSKIYKDNLDILEKVLEKAYCTIKFLFWRMKTEAVTSGPDSTAIY